MNVTSYERNFTCIVAADSNNGTGYQGSLPWPRLPADMAFFKQTTVGESPNRNAVVMGRKTWDSIPVKFRPLPERINIVLSSTMTVGGENYSTNLYVCRNGIDDAISLAEDLCVNELFVIGGGDVYAQAIKDPRCTRILLTRISPAFKADVFFPEFQKDFTCVDVSPYREHKEISFTFEEWKGL